MTHSDSLATSAVRDWLEQVVIKNNFCPFAGVPLAEGKIRFSVCSETGEHELLTFLAAELERLQNDQTLETSLLILDAALDNFLDYNQFLGLAESLLEQLNLIGVFQIASFHPRYQFSGTQANDPSNYTNRAPYPVLHLLREASVERACNSPIDVNAIPERNIHFLETASPVELERIRTFSQLARESGVLEQC